MRVDMHVTAGEAQSHTFALDEGHKLVLGRGKQADIQMDDPGLSRAHCVLEHEAGTLLLRDLDSANGTWVNGERITARFLMPDDVVRMGDIEFALHFEKEAPRDHQMILPGVEETKESRMKPEDTLLLSPAAAMERPDTAETTRRALVTLYNVGNLIHSETSLERLCDLIVEEIFHAVRPERGLLLLTKDHDKTLEVAAARSATLDSEEIQGTTNNNILDILYSTTIVSECFRSGEAILTSDAVADERFGEEESVVSQAIRSVICAPLTTRDEPLGVIYLDTRGSATDFFTRSDLELVAAIGKQAGIAIERARLIRDRENLFYGSIRTLVAAIEAKDPTTHGHSERVTAYCVKMATSLDLDHIQQNHVRLAALLHDVGKIGVPESLLNKEHTLTREEYSTIKDHSIRGAEIIKHIENIGPVVEAVRHHHERWDGKGYPDGLPGQSISLISRIISVADAYDAMVSERPTGECFSPAEALDELRDNRGTQFDPALVDLFISQQESLEDVQDS